MQSRAHEANKVQSLDVAIPMHLRGGKIRTVQADAPLITSSASAAAAVANATSTSGSGGGGGGGGGEKLVFTLLSRKVRVIVFGVDCSKHKND